MGVTECLNETEAMEDRQPRGDQELERQEIPCGWCPSFSSTVAVGGWACGLEAHPSTCFKGSRSSPPGPCKKATVPPCPARGPVCGNLLADRAELLGSIGYVVTAYSVRQTSGPRDGAWRQRCGLCQVGSWQRCSGLGVGAARARSLESLGPRRTRTGRRA